jgi:hypothetical protein
VNVLSLSKRVFVFYIYSLDFLSYPPGGPHISRSSGFPFELGFALGACDDERALPLGHAQALLATRTMIVLIEFAVLDSFGRLADE